MTEENSVESAEVVQLAKQLDELDVDDVSDALCEHLSTGKLECLRQDFDAEIQRRFAVEHRPERSPIQMKREWIVVEGDRILYRGDDRADAEAWQEANYGEVIAVPEGGVPSV